MRTPEDLNRQYSELDSKIVQLGNRTTVIHYHVPEANGQVTLPGLNYDFLAQRIDYAINFLLDRVKITTAKHFAPIKQNSVKSLEILRKDLKKQLADFFEEKEKDLLTGIDDIDQLSTLIRNAQQGAFAAFKARNIDSSHIIIKLAQLALNAECDAIRALVKNAVKAVIVPVIEAEPNAVAESSGDFELSFADQGNLPESGQVASQGSLADAVNQVAEVNENQVVLDLDKIREKINFTFELLQVWEVGEEFSANFAAKMELLLAEKKRIENVISRLRDLNESEMPEEVAMMFSGLSQKSMEIELSLSGVAEKLSSKIADAKALIKEIRDALLFFGVIFLLKELQNHPNVQTLFLELTSQAEQLRNNQQLLEKSLQDLLKIEEALTGQGETVDLLAQERIENGDEVLQDVFESQGQRYDHEVEAVYFDDYVRHVVKSSPSLEKLVKGKDWLNFSIVARLLGLRVYIQEYHPSTQEHPLPSIHSFGRNESRMSWSNESVPLEKKFEEIKRRLFKGWPWLQVLYENGEINLLKELVSKFTEKDIQACRFSAALIGEGKLFSSIEELAQAVFE